MPRHWAAINERSFVAGMRLLFWVFRRLGRWPFRLLLYPVLLWYLAFAPRARRVSAAYLARVAQRVPVAGGPLRHFAAFAESILDKMLLWGGLYETSHITLHGVDAVNRMLAQGQGGLLLCSHFGNLELCRVLSRQRPDVRLTVLVHTRHAQAFNRMLARLNPDSQLNLVQVTELDAAMAMQLSERIGRGELVVIAADRVPVAAAPRVAMAPFLGSPAAFPAGPYLLANALQCPVFLIFPLQLAQRTELHFELFCDRIRLPRKARAEALAELARSYAARLEYYCLQAPFQWFNFYDFWQTPELDSHHASR